MSMSESEPVGMHYLGDEGLVAELEVVVPAVIHVGNAYLGHGDTDTLTSGRSNGPATVCWHSGRDGRVVGRLQHRLCIIGNQHSTTESCNGTRLSPTVTGGTDSG